MTKAALQNNIHSFAQPDTNFKQKIRRFLMGETSVDLMPYIYSDDPNGMYQKKGSEMWNKLITEEPNYYLYKNEADLIADKGSEISKMIFKENFEKPVIVDLGPGSEGSVRKKSIPFLDAFHKTYRGIACHMPIEISTSFLKKTEELVRQRFPFTHIRGLEENFYDLQTPLEKHNNRISLFPGATIGNNPEEFGKPSWTKTIRSLKNLKQVVGKNGFLVIGYDANNDEDSLMKAYDNPHLHNHVMYLLDRICWEFPELGLQRNQFECSVEWVADEHRISYYAVAQSDMIVDGIAIPEGKKLHIGSSFKYPVAVFENIARQAGYEPIDYVTDDQERMVLHILKAVDQTSRRRQSTPKKRAA